VPFGRRQGPAGRDPQVSRPLFRLDAESCNR